jgi:hypothetical protein
MDQVPDGTSDGIDPSIVSNILAGLFTALETSANWSPQLIIELKNIVTESGLRDTDALDRLLKNTGDASH